MQNQAIWYLENIDVTGIFCPTKQEVNNHEKKIVLNSLKEKQHYYQKS